jgi:hypothetical protein
MTSDPPPPPGPPPPPSPPPPQGPPPPPGQGEPPGPPEPAGAAGDDPVELLVRAVGTLPAGQRDLVLTWLLRQQPSVYRHQALRDTIQARRVFAGEEPSQASAFGPELDPIIGTGSLRAAGATGQQVVPVRFPAEQHAQLREWCAEHGFSMATVIRGLVARFLESQAAS